MKTTANVWLLSTEYIEFNSIIKVDKALFLNNNDTQNIENNWISQHLYITLPQSDLEISEIKEEDWCIKWNGGKWKTTLVDSLQYKLINELWNEVDYKKIIATTDISLNINYKVGNIEYGIKLPSIPQSFIEHFISEYNKGNIIKEIEVELEEYEVESYGISSIVEYSEPSTDFRLKLNQQNEISIVIPEEKKYSKEEITNAFHKVELKHNKDYSELWKEIEQNL